MARSLGAVAPWSAVRIGQRPAPEGGAGQTRRYFRSVRNAASIASSTPVRNTTGAMAQTVS